MNSDSTSLSASLFTAASESLTFLDERFLNTRKRTMRMAVSAITPKTGPNTVILLAFTLAVATSGAVDSTR